MLTQAIKLLIIPYLAIAARIHGGGIISPLSRPIRNTLFAAPYLFISPMAFLAAFIGINIGHVNFWGMGLPNQNVNRPDWLTYIVSLLGFERDTLAWCWCGMAIKGAIIGLGSPILALSNAFLFPLAYYIGMRMKRNNEAAEPLSGLFMSIPLYIGVSDGWPSFLEQPLSILHQ